METAGNRKGNRGLSPIFLIVGMSGAACERLSPLVASPRSLPAFTCGSPALIFANIRWIWPAMSSMTAGPDPLYGTCVGSIFARLLKYSPAI